KPTPAPSRAGTPAMPAPRNASPIPRKAPPGRRFMQRPVIFPPVKRALQTIGAGTALCQACFTEPGEAAAGAPPRGLLVADVLLAADLPDRQSAGLQRFEAGVDHVRVAAQVSDVARRIRAELRQLLLHIAVA